MMCLTLLSLLCILPEGPADPKLEIWEEIAVGEELIRTSIARSDNQFSVFSNDPVRGYYIQRVGVVLFVPLRYRTNDRERFSERTQKTAFSLDKADTEKRMQAWKEKLQKDELTKEANFEKVVTHLKSLVPQLIATLKNLPAEASLTLIVEERLPAWYSSLSLKKNPTRKVVTLSLDKELITRIHANETIMEREWLDSIKRTTTNRRLVTMTR